MQKKVILLVAVFMLNAMQPQKASSDKVMVDYSVGINYVTHLYTLANIGFSDEEYANKYAHTVSLEDLKTLQKYQDYLVFAHGKTGVLTSYFFFIPAYANLKSKADYVQFRDDFAIAIQNKSYNTVQKYFSDKETACLLFSVSEEEWNNILIVNETFEEIINLNINNIDTYLTEVLPNIEKELHDRAAFLNNAVSEKEIISNWEEATGYNWSFGDKTYLLFRAGKNGPSFNNLSKNVNTLYYNMDDDYTMDMFSHEVGIYLISDSIAPLYEAYDTIYPEYESNLNIGRVNWMASEMLATFFNCKINGHKTLDYYNFGNADPIAFMTLYEQMYSQRITNPKDMYEKGAKEYMKPNGMWNTGVAERNKAFWKEKTMP